MLSPDVGQPEVNGSCLSSLDVRLPHHQVYFVEFIESSSFERLKISSPFILRIHHTISIHITT